MSKVASAIGKIAGAVAAVAVLIPGGQAIAAIAGAAAMAANVTSQLTARPPAARGNVSSVIVQADAPAPYLMGRTSTGGVMRHDVGYGGLVGKVQNPYRFMVLDYSVAGPIDGYEAFTADFESFGGGGTDGLTAATGYYADYLWVDRQIGAVPESNALAPHFAGAPNWTSAHKLSGKAAAALSLKFDKDGKRWSGQMPRFNAVARGVRVYDPRLDSTFPGGSGACRALDETTYVYSTNPALHALTYALGRWVDSKRVFGCGIPVAGIDVASFAAHANVCEANGWTIGGVIFEPGSRWQNLRDILSAGAASPVFAAGTLSVHYQAPRIALDSIDEDDLADDPGDFTPWPQWQEGINGIIPKYRSEANQWEYVQSALVSDDDLLVLDGIEKIEEVQFNLVQDADQAAALARYLLWERKEIGPLDITCKPRMRRYRPGDRLTVNLPDTHGLDGVDMVIVRRAFNPMTMTVQLTLMGDTDAKHDAAGEEVGTAPDAITLPTAEARDDAAATFYTEPTGEIATISASWMDEAAITGTDAGAAAQVEVTAHNRVYYDKTVYVLPEIIGPLSFDTDYWIYYDDAARAGGNVTMHATTTMADAYPSSTNPARHFAGTIRTPTDGGADTDGTPAAP